ncbi:MAG: AsmA family protein [Dongiaceae bacterium]
MNTTGTPKAKTPFWVKLSWVMAFVAALAIAGSFLIDVSKYRGLIEDKASEAIGQKVEIRGGVSGVLLPITSLSLKDVTVADGKILTTKEISAQIMPWELLSGVVDVRQVKLDEPNLILAVDKDGNLPIAFPGGDKKDRGASQEGGRLSSMRIAINEIVIENGALTYRGVDGEPFKVTNLNTTINPNIEKRAVKMKGEANLNGTKTEFDIDAAAAPANQPMPVTAAIKRPDGEINFKGNVNVAAKSVAGQFSGKTSLGGGISAKGNIAGNQEALSFKDLSGEAMGHKFTGQANVALGDTPKVAAQLSAAGAAVDVQGTLATKPAMAFRGQMKLDVPDVPQSYQILTGEPLSWQENLGRRLVATSGIAANERTITFSAIQGSLGKITASGSADVGIKDKNFRTDLEFRADSLRAILGPDLAADGKPSGRAQITAPLGGEVLKNARGTISYEVKEGEVYGIDLPALSEQLKNINGIPDLLNMLQIVQNKGKTPFERLYGSAQLAEGHLRTNNTRLEAAVAKGEASGDINLIDKTINAEASMRLTQHPKAPPLGVKVAGALSKPQYQIQSDAIKNYVAQRGAEKLIQRLDKDNKVQEKIQNLQDKLFNRLPQLGQ